MSVFSFSWFKSQREKELENLLIEEQRLKNELLRRDLPKTTVDLTTLIKPYKSLRLVNNVLTVVLNDGSLISKPEATALDFERVRSATTEFEIIKAIGDVKHAQELAREKDEQVRAERVVRGMDVLTGLKDFVVKDGSVYLKGISRSMPQLLVEKFAEIVHYYPDGGYETDEEFLSLKRFFMWCCLNPRAEVADQLYDFLHKNGMRITKQGFFVALRNVVEVKDGNDKEIVTFISNAYNKVKGVWKKRPEDFRVVQSGKEYSLNKIGDEPKGKVLGTLSDLYINLPNMKENRFTDDYTRTFDIRIGRVVSMPMGDCNWSTRDCAAAGLHFAGHTAPYVLCGDTSVFMLINPMKVVGIGPEKGRCYEYLPFMTTSVEEASEIMESRDYDFLQMDEEYTIHELDSLVEKAQAGFTAETKKYQFNLPHISLTEISDIAKSLEAMKKEIGSRISKIK